MAGAKTLDTDKLVRLMGVAVIIVIVLIALAVGLVIVKDVSNIIPGMGSPAVPEQTPGQNIRSDGGQPTVPADDPSYDPVAQAREAYIRALNEAAAKQTGNDTSIDDSVTEIPVYGSEKANTLSATSPKENGNISLGYYQVLFEKKYDYRKKMGNSSLLVDVNRGPLVVHYEVSNPTVSMSTTGSKVDKDLDKKYQGNYDDKGKEIDGLPFENPNYCNAAITIIDNTTGKIVASDGFGITDSSVTKKDVTVYSVGEYLIYCTGTGLEIDVKVITGATEDNPNAIAVDTSAKDAFSSLTRSGTKTVKTGTSTGSSSEVDDESIPPWERW